MIVDFKPFLEPLNIHGRNSHSKTRQKIKKGKKNEFMRLKELDSYQIIGEMEEFDYDFLTQMASQICETKISLISLVTESKQWFLSHHGLECRETPREFAFCAHAIQQPDEIFIIEDSRQDLRFRENPLVTGDPFVIFYVGVPLVNENGYALGTLCVIDNSPKRLNEQQMDSLKMLSRQVVNLLELRRKTKELNHKNNQLSLTSALFKESQRLSKIGSWELNLTTGITFWTDEVYAIHEVGFDFDHNSANGIDFYHPDDRVLIRNALWQTMEIGDRFDVTCRFISAKGQQKWVRTTGIKWQEKGEYPRLVGSFQDVTDIVQSKLELEETLAKNQAIFNSSTEVSIISTDTQGVITSFNKGAEILLGYAAEEIVGKYTPEIIHHRHEVESVGKELSLIYEKPVVGFEVFVHKAQVGQPDTREWTYIRKDGTAFPVLLSVTAIVQQGIITGYLGIGLDISELKSAKEKMELMEVTRAQNERLKNFAHIVSHNLRSHAGGISMLLEFFKAEHPAIFETEIFKHIRNASDNLTETLKHLTEVVHINLERKVNTSPVQLYPVVERNISGLLGQAQAENVLLINEVPKNLKVLALPAYLESIMINFISNGIKYSSSERESYVKISAEIVEDYVVLIFKDNGLGIDLERHRSKLFGIYKTFHEHKDSRGIGLFISKNQIDSMGGKVEVESEVNVGTTFKIYLRYEKN